MFAHRRFAAVVAAAALLLPLLVWASPASAQVGHNPIGHLDGLTYTDKYNAIYIWGWAGDLDAGSAAGQRVHLYIDGKGAAAVSTGLPRTDVAKVYASLGLKTGFSAFPTAPPGRGTHTVCVYAINRGLGANTLLDCRSITVTLAGRIIGHIDSIAPDPQDASMRVAQGWALDPYDALSPTPYELFLTAGPDVGLESTFLDGEAGLPRPDVDLVYPNNGHNHGFRLTFAAADVNWVATDEICLEAYNGFFPFEGVPTPYCFIYAG